MKSNTYLLAQTAHKAASTNTIFFFNSQLLCLVIQTKFLHILYLNLPPILTSIHNISPSLLNQILQKL